MPARWGLQQTTLAPGTDKTRARDPLVRYKLPNIEKYGPTTGHILLRQGEPGTSPYNEDLEDKGKVSVHIR